MKRLLLLPLLILTFITGISSCVTESRYHGARYGRYHYSGPNYRRVHREHYHDNRHSHYERRY